MRRSILAATIAVMSLVGLAVPTQAATPKAPSYQRSVDNFVNTTWVSNTAINTDWQASSGCGGTCYKATRASIHDGGPLEFTTMSMRVGRTGNSNCVTRAVQQPTPPFDSADLMLPNDCNTSGALYPYISFTFNRKHPTTGATRSDNVVYYLCRKLVFNGSELEPCH